METTPARPLSPRRERGGVVGDGNQTKKLESGTKVEEEIEEEDAAENVSDDDNGGPSALGAILSARQRRRALLSATGRDKGGTDAAALLVSRKRDVVHQDEEGPQVANKDLAERLQGTFAGGGSGNDGGSGVGVLERKHKQAMEEYINKKLGRGEGKRELSGGGAPSVSEGAPQESRNLDAVEAAASKDATRELDEARLYQELAAAASGRDTSQPEEAPSGEADGGEEGDVGFGGAMLSGTGIAEVVLPVDERIKNVRETERLAAAKVAARSARRREGFEYRAGPAGGGGNSAEPAAARTMLPFGFASGPGKRRKVPPLDEGTSGIISSSLTKRITPLVSNSSASNADISQPYSASSAGPGVLPSDVSDLGASYAHNFRLHTREWVQKRKEERDSEIEVERRSKGLETDETAAAGGEGVGSLSGSRLGFDAARKIAKGEAPAAVTTVLNAAGGADGSNSRSSGDKNRNEWNRGGDGSSRQRSSDDRVYRTFVAHQRNRMGRR